MLSSLIHLPVSQGPEESEDIFTSALGLIFTDDINNQHGAPDVPVSYHSRRFGPIKLILAEPGGEGERRLFAHYLWNAGVLLGELIAGWEWDDRNAAVEGREKHGEAEDHGMVKKWKADPWARGQWNVKGEKILELGAGTGLASIMATLAGAATSAITDYPSSALLAAIEQNTSANIPASLRTRITIAGHDWADLHSPFAHAYAHTCTRVLSADCLWMPSQHSALAGSMAHFLARTETARVWVVAGFHTGRQKAVEFFDAVVEVGLVVEDVWEMDADGRTRECWYQTDGGREDVTARKKWLILAVLRWPAGTFEGAEHDRWV